jgi:hypothetical protein
MSIAGHVSARMLAHYSHTRLEAKRTALEALSRNSKGKRDVTIDVTKQTRDAQHELQVKYGGRDRDRTCDLMLAKHALSQLSYTPILIYSKRLVSLWYIIAYAGSI